jgi:Rps23 Pro-64 3,4-dihydroxylase Tpa1-like proline 4-hydroxylase
MESLQEEYRILSRETFGYWHRAKWILKEADLIEMDYPRVIEFTRVVTDDYSLGKPDTTFSEIVEHVSGFTNMYTNQPSYSAYDNTSWLNPHHDPKRFLAYIFYFNPGWKAHWGGQLCIMNDDEHTIKHSIEPFGNRLVLMDITERINKHFISPVNYIAPYPRYSLAGWFYPIGK